MLLKEAAASVTASRVTMLAKSNSGGILYGMAKKAALEEMGEMLSHVVKHMTTKDDISSMATKEDIAGMKREMVTKEELKAFREETAESFRDVKAEIADIRCVVEGLQGRVRNTEGYSKEIDHALARIARIEKHLGIEPQLAA